jgi:hypothetical protein
MEEVLLLDEKTVRVLDILEQIKKLNTLIDLHRTQGDALSWEQYEQRRTRYLDELTHLLSDFQIEAHLSSAAA